MRSEPRLVGTAPSTQHLDVSSPTANVHSLAHLSASADCCAAATASKAEKDKTKAIMSGSRVFVVLGAGVGVSHSTALRFAQHGFNVALVSRKVESASKTLAAIAALGSAVRAKHFACDATSEPGVKETFAAIKAEFGPVDVLLNNVNVAGAIQAPPLHEMTLAQFEQPFRSVCSSAFLATQQVLPDMMAAGRGTILFTGATAGFRGSASSCAFPSAMSAVRMLAQSVAKAYSKHGVHVVHLRIDGVVDNDSIRKAWPGVTTAQLVDPEAVADLYWFASTQQNRGVCNELDIRTTVENWTI